MLLMIDTTKYNNRHEKSKFLHTFFETMQISVTLFFVRQNKNITSRSERMINLVVEADNIDEALGLAIRKCNESLGR